MSAPQSKLVTPMLRTTPSSPSSVNHSAARSHPGWERSHQANWTNSSASTPSRSRDLRTMLRT